MGRKSGSAGQRPAWFGQNNLLSDTTADRNIVEQPVRGCASVLEATKHRHTIISYGPAPDMKPYKGRLTLRMSMSDRQLRKMHQGGADSPRMAQPAKAVSDDVRRHRRPYGLNDQQDIRLKKKPKPSMFHTLHHVKPSTSRCLALHSAAPA